MNKWCLTILLLFCSSGAISGQTDDPIKVESAIVRVNVGVVDQRGRPVMTLTRRDFEVFEDGTKQEITRFEATEAPFSVVMLLDMSGSTKSFRQNIKLAAARFLDALGPQDRVAVVEFYSKINLLNDFTTDHSRAAFAISCTSRTQSSRFLAVCAPIVPLVVRPMWATMTSAPAAAICSASSVLKT